MLEDSTIFKFVTAAFRRWINCFYVFQFLKKTTISSEKSTRINIYVGNVNLDQGLSRANKTT